MSEILEKLMWRYAVKSFDPSKEIPSEDLKDIQNALILTPSSFGLQPWKFLFIKNREIRERLKTFSWNQSQVTDASHLVVILAKKDMTSEYISHFIDRIAEERNVSKDTLIDYQNMMINYCKGRSNDVIRSWNKDQTYIALGNLLTTCALMGIDSCPMEGFEPIQYDRELHLEGTGFTASVICAIGFRSDNDHYATLKKVRFPVEELVENID